MAHHIISPVPEPLQPIVFHPKSQILLPLVTKNPKWMRDSIACRRPNQMPILVNYHRPRSPHITSPRRKQSIQPIVAQRAVLDIIQGQPD